MERLARAIEGQLAHWRWRPVVEALQALRGISAIHAVRIVAELGDFHRFETPRKLMGYLGMVPSEASSGARRRQGSITKAGNSSARRAMVEAAWAYAHPARVSWVIARRQSKLAKSVCDTAWKAQLRLCARFRKLAARGIPRTRWLSRWRASSRASCGRSLESSSRCLNRSWITTGDTLAQTNTECLLANAARPRLENPRRTLLIRPSGRHLRS